MIKIKKSIDYTGIKIIEKFILIPPFRVKELLNNRSCFIFTKGTDLDLFTNKGKETIYSNESVVLRCGAYLLNWVKENNNKKEVTVFAVHLYPEIIKMLYNDELPALIKNKTSKENILKIDTSNIVKNYIESLDFYFENQSIVTNEIVRLKIKELIAILIQTKHYESVFQLLSESYSQCEIKIRTVVEYNLFESINISELAFLCNMSISKFKKEFKLIYQDSPLQYINRNKVEKGRKLLIQTNLTVSEITSEIGLIDANYFSRMFKKYFGMSPTKYRAKN